MQRIFALMLALVVTTASMPNHSTAYAAAESDEPPSLSLPIALDLSVVGSKLSDIQVGESHNAKLEREAAEAKRIADESAAKAAEQARIKALQKKQPAPKPATQVEVRAEVPQQEPSGSNNSELQILAQQLVTERWEGSQWPFFQRIIQNESGWNPNALNTSSGACGLPQALPCSKIPGGRKASAEVQVEWAVTYIANRYGTPEKAWAFWQKNRWY